MLRLSIVSAHLFHPDVPKVCLVPEGGATGVARRLASLAVEHGCTVTTLPVAIPTGNDRIRSRWLKTHLYRVIGADAVALDVDTLIVQPLSFQAIPPAAISVAINQDGIAGRPFSSSPWISRRFERCGWHWDVALADQYCNSGVIVYRQSDAARDFSDCWIDHWNYFRTATGEHYDQPAFNHTAFELGGIGRLPSPWNAPVAILPQQAHDAVIFHYYASANEIPPQHTLWGWLLMLDSQSRLPHANRLRAILSARRPFVAVGASMREYACARQWWLLARTVLHRGPRSLALKTAKAILKNVPR